MSIAVVIDGTTYNLPTQGQNPAWGDDLSDIIVALVAVANSTTGPGDIQTTTFVIPNNQTSPIAVTALFFDQSTIRSAQIDYSIDLSSSTTELVENGSILINYNTTSNTWNQTQWSNGFTGVVFSITNGQLFLTSPNLSGTNYSGVLSFNAKALEVFGQ